MRLTPRNRAIGEFTFGSWSWSYLLDLAGPVFPGFWSKGARWYMVMGDPRFKDGDYPEVLGDSGRHFYVRADEARHLARVARSWAIIQAQLPDENKLDGLSGKPDWQRPFPEKVRADWPPLFLAFADWAERSRGFSK